jgi:hypothetical protein
MTLATFTMGALCSSSSIGQGAGTPAPPGDAVKNLRTDMTPDPGATELSRRIAAAHRRRRMQAEEAEQQTKALMAANQEPAQPVAPKPHKAAISRQAAGADARPALAHKARHDTGKEDAAPPTDAMTPTDAMK